MTQEEKARAYDSIIEKANKMHSENCEACKACIEELIPELAESEDEKIRKWIINEIKIKHHNLDEENVDFVDKAIAWLEKQGQKDILEDAILDGNKDGLIAETIRYKHEKQSKQKLDKVEPKFNIGDFIANDYCFGKVIALTDDAYLLDTEQGVPFSCEHNVHLWTIADAKNGDVLVNGSNIFMFHFINDTRLMGYCHVNTDNGRFYDDICKNECFCLIDAVVNPATKEQRDLLFHRMKEAGYEWDAGKKELNKINSYCQENCKGFQETGKCFADGECKAKREAEQKSVIWSEEDEDHVNSLLKRLKGLCRKEFTTTRFAINEDEDWLKSLRGRVQPKQEWSEEDESILQGIWDEILANKHDAKECEWKTYDKFLNWLKSLRPQK